MWVARKPSGNRLVAEYRLSDLKTAHWSNLSGGTMSRTNRFYVHGYVYCDGMLSGELDHSCEHGPPPHFIKVCVVAVDNDIAVMKHLKAVADERTAAEQERYRRFAELHARPGL